MSPLRILITGAGGMLGYDVTALAIERGHEASSLARLDLDIADPAAVGAVLRRERLDVVINCAAYTKVDLAEDDVDAARRANAIAPGVLGAAAARVGAWVVHVSTDYVFDGTKTSGPYVESDPTGPRSVYGSTKLDGERALASAAPDSHTIVRSSWLFGNSGPCFPATILRAAASRPQLKVVNDQIGSPTFTPHLAGALLDLSERRHLTGVVHVAAGGQTSWHGFASALVSAAAADGRRHAGSWAEIAPCSTAEYPTAAQRPAFSLLRSEREGAPVLPDWQAGLDEYMTVWADTEGEL